MKKKIILSALVFFILISIQPPITRATGTKTCCAMLCWSQWLSTEGWWAQTYCGQISNNMDCPHTCNPPPPDGYGYGIWIWQSGDCDWWWINCIGDMD